MSSRSTSLLPGPRPASNALSALASQWNWGNQATRVVIPPGGIVAEGYGSGWCYLVERGLAATYVTVDRDRATCVDLLGPGEMIGLYAVLGRPDDSSRQARAVVTTQAMQVPAAAVARALRASPALHHACMSQLQARLNGIQHVAACNARHLLPARCAHWLLKLEARIGDVLPVTHEFLATVLGVRRAGVTVTLQGLQRSGAIRQQRGSIVIEDAARLRQAACSCPVSPTDLAPVSPEAVPSAGLIQPSQVNPDWRDRIRITAPDGGGRDQMIARIDNVLEACRMVMEQTRIVLAG